MSEEYVDIQDGQKPSVKGWPIVINGKRTENIDVTTPPNKFGGI
jgi:hypothetical protein